MSQSESVKAFLGEVEEVCKRHHFYLGMTDCYDFSVRDLRDPDDLSHLLAAEDFTEEGRRLDREDRYRIIQRGLDKYITDQQACGNSAREEDIRQWCRLKNMPFESEYARVRSRL